MKNVDTLLLAGVSGLPFVFASVWAVAYMFMWGVR